MRSNDPVPGYGYWDEHPDYPVEDWIYDVKNGNTRSGYWAWVKSRIELNELF